MEIIAFHNCDDHYHARKKEQHYYKELNATLNSIEPYAIKKEKKEKENIEKKILYCNSCKVYFNTPRMHETHNKTNKHIKRIQMDDKENTENFYCEKCHFKCSKLSEWNRHILTTKHKMEIVDINRKSLKTPQLFKCECEKIYQNNSGLWKHKKKCTYIEEEEKEEKEKEEAVIEKKEEEPDYKELLVKAMTQMSKQQTQLAEQQKQIAEIMPLIGNNNTTNSNNNTTNNFNLNFFLNETCKDALNITDFINSLQIQLKDLEYTADNGHIKGITNIFQRALSNMEVTKRPMHCTDLKRETLYIKDNNE
jgi:hypothetical protein